VFLFCVELLRLALTHYLIPQQDLMVQALEFDLENRKHYVKQSRGAAVAASASDLSDLFTAASPEDSANAALGFNVSGPVTMLLFFQRFSHVVFSFAIAPKCSVYAGNLLKFVTIYRSALLLHPPI
jgi:hypothetical protein